MARATKMDTSWHVFQNIIIAHPSSVMPSRNSFLVNSHCVAARNFHATTRTLILAGSRLRSSQNCCIPSIPILFSSWGSKRRGKGEKNTAQEWNYLCKLSKFLHTILYILTKWHRSVLHKYIPIVYLLLKQTHTPTVTNTKNIKHNTTKNVIILKKITSLTCLCNDCRAVQASSCPLRFSWILCSRGLGSGSSCLWPLLVSSHSASGSTQLSSPQPE